MVKWSKMALSQKGRAGWEHQKPCHNHGISFLLLRKKNLPASDRKGMIIVECVFSVVSIILYVFAANSVNKQRPRMLLYADIFKSTEYHSSE